MSNTDERPENHRARVMVDTALRRAKWCEERAGQPMKRGIQVTPEWVGLIDDVRWLVAENERLAAELNQRDDDGSEAA